MTLKRSLLVFSLAFIIIILLVGCGKSATPTPVENPSNTQAPVNTVENTPVATKPPKTIPEDVPIMPDSYDLQVASQLNLEYKIKLPIQDIVSWYQAELPNFGWDMAGNPDSVVGSMATMARSKDNGDRINLAYQWNMIGEFTVVTIYLTRAP